MGEDGAVGEEEGAMQKVRRSKFEVRIRKCGAADDDVLAVERRVRLGDERVGVENGGGGGNREIRETRGKETQSFCRKRARRAQRERGWLFFELFEFFAANPFRVRGFGFRVHGR